MNKTDERKLERLTDRAIRLSGKLNALEKTFSRLKDETEELLRKLLKRNDKG